MQYIAVRSAALRASARSLAGCRTDGRTDDNTQTGDRQVRTTLGILWLPKQRVKLAPCAGKASDDYQTSTDKQHRHDLTIFFTIFYWRREEVVEENHGRNTWKKFWFFIQFLSFCTTLNITSFAKVCNQSVFKFEKAIRKVRGFKTILSVNTEL